MLAQRDKQILKNTKRSKLKIILWQISLLMIAAESYDLAGAWES